MGGAHIFQLLMGPNSEAAIRSRDGGFGSSEKACHCQGHYGALRVAVHPPGVLSLAITIMFLQKGPQSWAPPKFKTAAAPPAPWLLARLAGHLRTWWASPVALALTTPEALLEGCPHTKATLWTP